ncbi:MAG TPA: [FeFe] hydrogenase H-cluster radical SAM maturase HydE [Candidatus Wallbacteria bacterium]|nr:[FeFe] hydrogenase H-cluster radical SAM maturase HydE [Candidatus Wallbacteria bacterium]
MLELIKKAEKTHSLDKNEIVSILNDGSIDAELFAAADRVREKFVGNDVHLRGLIEFSNACARNCFYCGLRRDNKSIERYKLDTETIIKFAAAAAEMGYKTLVLQSGEIPSYTVDIMAAMISEIKKLGVTITLSIGEKSRDEYAAYRAAGADRYLLRIETTNRDLYEKLDPGMSFDNRLRCLKDLKSLGYELGTGSLVGLPGQSSADIASDILFFKEIDADMIGCGPFIPNPDTPLANERGGTFELAIKVIALVRLLLPDVNIPATTAMEALNPAGRLIALRSGANVVMPNVTDGEYKKKYILYPGKICLNESPGQCIGCITGKIQSIGRNISKDHGYRKKVK